MASRTLTLTPRATAVANNAVIIIDALFSEDVTGFTISDVTASLGTVFYVGGSGSSYTISLRAPTTGTGTINISVAADVVPEGNAAARASVILAARTVSISAASSVIQGVPVTVSIYFTGGSVTGFDINDITTSHGTLTNLSGSSQNYQVTLTPPSSYTGTLTLSIAEDVVTEGNAANSLEINITKNTVTILPTVWSYKDNETIQLNFSFGVAVTDFTISDITTSAGTLSSFSGSQANYAVRLTTPSSNSPNKITISISADVTTGGNEPSSFILRKTTALDSKTIYGGEVLDLYRYCDIDLGTTVSSPVDLFMTEDYAYILQTNKILRWDIANSRFNPAAGYSLTGSIGNAQRFTSDGTHIYILYGTTYTAVANTSAQDGSMFNPYANNAPQRFTLEKRTITDLSAAPTSSWTLMDQGASSGVTQNAQEQQPAPFGSRHYPHAPSGKTAAFKIGRLPLYCYGLATNSRYNFVYAQFITQTGDDASQRSGANHTKISKTNGGLSITTASPVVINPFSIQVNENGEDSYFTVTDDKALNLQDNGFMLNYWERHIPPLPVVGDFGTVRTARRNNFRPSRVGSSLVGISIVNNLAWTLTTFRSTTRAMLLAIQLVDGIEEPTGLTVTLTPRTTSIEQGGTSIIDIVFSSAVTGFVIGDITKSAGTLSAFSGSGTTYEVTLTAPATGSGTVTVTVPADVTTEGNSAGSTTVSYTLPATVARWNLLPKCDIVFDHTISPAVEDIEVNSTHAYILQANKILRYTITPNTFPMLVNNTPTQYNLTSNKGAAKRMCADNTHIYIMYQTATPVFTLEKRSLSNPNTVVFTNTVTSPSNTVRCQGLATNNFMTHVLVSYANSRSHQSTNGYALNKSNGSYKASVPWVTVAHGTDVTTRDTHFTAATAVLFLGLWDRGTNWGTPSQYNGADTQDFEDTTFAVPSRTNTLVSHYKEPLLPVLSTGSQGLAALGMKGWTHRLHGNGDSRLVAFQVGLPSDPPAIGNTDAEILLGYDPKDRIRALPVTDKFSTGAVTSLQ